MNFEWIFWIDLKEKGVFWKFLRVDISATVWSKMTRLKVTHFSNIPGILKKIAKRGIFVSKISQKVRTKSSASEKWRIFGNFVEPKMRHFLVKQCYLKFENTKIIFELIFDPKQPYQKKFRKFWFLEFLFGIKSEISQVFVRNPFFLENSLVAWPHFFGFLTHFWWKSDDIVEIKNQTF